MQKLASLGITSDNMLARTPPVVPQLSDIISGRRSSETDSVYRSEKLQWDYIKQYIPLIEFLIAWQSDFAQITADMQQLAGTGHEVTVIGAREKDVNLAQTYLNQFARRIRPELGGLPGVINESLMQLFSGGAISQEWEVLFENTQKTRGGVVAVHRVDIPTLLLEYNNRLKRYIPYQEQDDGGKKALKYPTYQLQVMRALTPVPYPIPPFLSALAEMDRLSNALASIDKAIKKLGLIGLIALQVKKPIRMFFETELAYQTRLKAYLGNIHSVLMQGMQDGIVTHYDPIETPKMLNFSGEINNSVAIMKFIQSRLRQGLGDWLSEDKARASSWVAIFYEKMLSKLQHTQGLVSSVLETGILLHLLLKGLKIYNVRLSFSQDSERYWKKANTKVTFFKELVESFDYPKEKALRHLGYGEEENMRFPLEVQDVLSQGVLKLHESHTDTLYMKKFYMNHYEGESGGHGPQYKGMFAYSIPLGDIPSSIPIQIYSPSISTAS